VKHVVFIFRTDRIMPRQTPKTIAELRRGKKIYAHERKCEKGKGKNARTKDGNKKWAPNKAAIRERAGTKYG
jgi:hypothetical protein